MLFTFLQLSVWWRNRGHNPCKRIDRFPALLPPTGLQSTAGTSL